MERSIDEPEEPTVVARLDRCVPIPRAIEEADGPRFPGSGRVNAIDMEVIANNPRQRLAKARDVTRPVVQALRIRRKKPLAAHDSVERALRRKESSKALPVAH